MLLAIDMGNTNIVIGCIHENKVLFTERMETDLRKTDLEYAIAIKTVLELHAIAPDALEGAILSSVVPPLVPVLREALTKISPVELLVVNCHMNIGMPIRMDNPETVGSDLLVDAAAALAQYGAPAIVIDMGTATTLSIVSEDCAYVGTIILAGPRIALDSLVSGTAQLTRIGLNVPDTVIGSNTADCMRSGVLYGSAAMLDGMIDRIWEELGYRTNVIATGGLAHVVVPHCRHEIIVNDNLLLQGLKLIYEKNRRNGR